MAIIPALIPVIKEVTLDVAAASVAFTVPNGYGILFLEWHNVMGDDNSARAVKVTFNGDTGNNYDISFVAFGTASSTVNATAFVQIAATADADGLNRVSNGSAIIFNRTGTEKVVIGSDGRWDAADGSGTVNDFTGAHIEGKWRTTAGVITSITITPAIGNFLANSKFIIRGLRTNHAPALGSQDIMQFIGSQDFVAAGNTFSGIPKGYAMLWLFWHDIYGDSIASRDILMTFNGDAAGNYDDSLQPFGTASSTLNAEADIIIGEIGDTDGVQQHSSGFLTIFNRAGQEKVVIGTRFRTDKANGSGTIEDVVGYHLEGKWRNTTDEISTLALVPSVNSFAAGKFWLIGVRIP